MTKRKRPPARSRTPKRARGAKRRKQLKRMRDSMPPGRRLLVRQASNCYYCLAQVDKDARTVDHLLPLSRRGTNALSNLVMSCKPCNTLKDKLTDHEFLGNAEAHKRRTALGQLRRARKFDNVPDVQQSKSKPKHEREREDVALAHEEQSMVTMSITPSRYKVQATKKNEVFVAIKLKTPEAPPGRIRPPLCISAALDNSGSMQSMTSSVYDSNDKPRLYLDDQGILRTETVSSSFQRKQHRPATKLDVAKFALIRLVEQLGDQDTFSLVTFSNTAYVHFAPCRMDARGRLEAIAAINQVHSADMTNLEAGLVESGRLLARGALTVGNLMTAVHRVMLFTDGQTNIGALSLASIIASFDIVAKFSLEGGATRGIGISTFGFGTGYDGPLLTGLAEHGGGSHYFIDSAERIPQAFGTEFATLVGTYAKNVRLLIENEIGHSEKGAGSGVGIELVNPLKETSFGLGSGMFEVECDDLLYDQEYNVVLRLDMAKLSKAQKNPRQILQVVGSLIEAESGNMQTFAGTLEMFQTTKNDADKSDNAEVMSAVSVATAARDQKHAQEMAEAGDVAGAKDMLLRSVATHRAYGNEAMAAVTIGSTQSAYSSQETYETVGNKMTKSLGQTLSKQNAGTGGAIVGGINVDKVFATPEQSRLAAAFSITKSADKNDADDMPNVADMITTR